MGRNKTYSFADPEEQVRAAAYVELIERYKYTADRLDTEVYPPQRHPKLPADIVVYQPSSDKVFLVVETKAEETEKKIEEARREGLGNATLLDAKYLWLVCGTEKLSYNVAGKPALASIERHRVADIPVAYGKEPKYKFRKGDRDWDLREVSFNQLQVKFQAAHNEIWEGGKRDPASAFDEMSKVMFAKIYDERFTKTGDYYRIQIGTNEDAKAVVTRLLTVFTEAQSKEPGVFRGEIELPPATIARLVEILQDVSLSRTDLDAKGRAFEAFLTGLFRGQYGQYFTRREIVQFMVEMLDPSKNDIVIDPACGSGGFLLYTVDRIRTKAAQDYAGDERTVQEIYFHFPRDNVFGIEINDRIARIAMMNMVMVASQNCCKNETV
jgi:type I restriction enzyme M protein